MDVVAVSTVLGVGIREVGARYAEMQLSPIVRFGFVKTRAAGTIANTAREADVVRIVQVVAAPFLTDSAADCGGFRDHADEM